MAAFLALLPSLIQAGVSIWQMVESSKYAKEEKPAYEIPESLKQSLASAQQQARQIELPGQSLAEEKLSGATSKVIGAAREATDSPAALLGMVSSLQEGETSKLRDLAIAAGENYNVNQGILREQLGQMGEQEKAQWQWDKALPYTQAMATASGLQEAGQENLMKALGSAATSYVTMKSTDDYIKALENSDAAAKQNVTDIIAAMNKGGDKSTDKSVTNLLNPSTTDFGSTATEDLLKQLTLKKSATNPYEITDPYSAVRKKDLMDLLISGYSTSKLRQAPYGG